MLFRSGLWCLRAMSAEIGGIMVPEAAASAVGANMGTDMSARARRIEVITRIERRRRWSSEENRARVTRLDHAAAGKRHRRLTALRLALPVPGDERVETARPRRRRGIGGMRESSPGVSRARRCRLLRLPWRLSSSTAAARPAGSVWCVLTRCVPARRSARRAGRHRSVLRTG